MKKCILSLILSVIPFEPLICMEEIPQTSDEDIKAGVEALTLEDNIMEDIITVVLNRKEMLDTIQCSKEKYGEHTDVIELALQEFRDTVQDLLIDIMRGIIKHIDVKRLRTCNVKIAKDLMHRILAINNLDEKYGQMVLKVRDRWFATMAAIAFANHKKPLNDSWKTFLNHKREAFVHTNALEEKEALEIEDAIIKIVLSRDITSQIHKTINGALENFIEKCVQDSLKVHLEINQIEDFKNWFEVQDDKIQTAVQARLRLAAVDNLRNTKLLDDKLKLFEFRWNNGTRVYFTLTNAGMHVLMGQTKGEKNKQDHAIAMCKTLLKRV